MQEHNYAGVPIGQLRRFRIEGNVLLSWLCDCPDCHARHGKHFRINVTVLDADEDSAVNQALSRTNYEFEDAEWEEGPTVTELSISEHERMEWLGAPKLL